VGEAFMVGKRNITSAHYQGLGEIVATWARLESHMFRTFEGLLDISLMQAIAVFWEMPFSARVERIKGLITLRWRMKGDARRKEFEKLIEEIEGLYFIRNLAAHSVWKKGGTVNSIVPLFINAKRGKIKTTHPQFPELEDREFTPERLRKEAEKIYDAAERFKRFVSIHFKIQFMHQTDDEGFD
jgi:hypothetical protein